MQGLRGSTTAGPLLIIALVVLAAAPKGASGRPWNVTFDGCVFTGDTDGSPLVRQGSCPDQAGLLDLSHKNITVVPGTAFRCMTQIWWLDLSNNKITDLPREIFAGLTSLVGLNISNNQIRNFRDGKQPLPETIFANLVSLKYLDMSNNSYFVPLPEGIFVGLNLSALDVSGNMLTCVPSNIDLEVYHGPYNELKPNYPLSCSDQKFNEDQRKKLNEDQRNVQFAYLLMILMGVGCFVWSWLFVPKYRRQLAYCARFDSMDTNGDGYINEEEFKKGWSTTPTSHLKWKDVGSEKPSTGTEIKNELLAAELQKKVEFKKEEWDEFHLADLSIDSYIKAGNHYFKPEEIIDYISKEDSTPKQDVMHLQWKDVGAEKPSTGTEINNLLLAAALLEKVQFKKEEWDKFHLANLSSDSYIKAGNCYFKPAESIVWKDEKWVDEQTGNPSNKKGKSSKDSKKSLWKKNSKNLYSKKSHYPLKNFPFKWLDKDKKEKISRKEYEEGFELVEAFLQFEAGICLPLCLLLRAKYLDEKEKKKETPNIVGELGLGVSHPSPLPGTPSPAEIPRDGHSLCGGRCKQQSAAPKCQKCDIKTLKMGCSAVAAQGLRSAVGLDDDDVIGNMMKDPEIAIECEILFAGLGGHVDGCIDDIDNYYSVKFGKSGDWEEEEIIIGKRKQFKNPAMQNQKFEDDKVFPFKDDENCKAPIPQHVKNSAATGKYHGGDFKKEDYDKGNKGKKLKDFHNDPASVLAGLFIYEVLVLRLYTSTTYRIFNGPMRSLLATDGQKSQHPLRFTIYALTEGVKKLRAVETRIDEKGFNTTKVLWCGMTNMKLDETLESVGGTEMAVMSTTSDKEVALSYASSESPLVFKYNTVGLTRGVKIQFLSLYPKEVEFVYPPLTFLSVVKSVEGNARIYVEGKIRIVEVMPQMS